MEQQPRTPDTLRAVPHPTMLTSSGHILFRFIARLSSGPASKGLLLPFQSFRARDSQAKPSLDNSGPLPPGIQAPSPSGLPSSPEKSPAQTGLLSAPEYTVYISSFCTVLTLPAACVALIQPIFSWLFKSNPHFKPQPVPVAFLRLALAAPSSRLP